MSLKENMTLRIINDVFVSRPALISFLNDRLKGKVPENIKTEAAIIYYIKNMEQESCQTIFKDIGFNIKVENFEEAYEIYKLGFLYTFFTMKELAQMAEELSGGQTKWRFKRGSRRSLLQSILKNATTREHTWTKSKPTTSNPKKAPHHSPSDSSHPKQYTNT